MDCLEPAVSSSMGLPTNEDDQCSRDAREMEIFTRYPISAALGGLGLVDGDGFGDGKYIQQSTAGIIPPPPPPFPRPAPAY